MADDGSVTIRANFETREAADFAVEHLVQQVGISRPDIFVQSSSMANTSGSKTSRGDASHRNSSRVDAPLAGNVGVSVDIAAKQLRKVSRNFRDLGTMPVSSR